MDAMKIYATHGMATIPAKDFTPTLFDGFVAWIDRGAKTTRSYLSNLKQFAAWLKYAAIRNPTRQDIISYRQWLTAEHDAIRIDHESASGWAYRMDARGNALKIVCKPNTVKQYLRIVCQFFRWTAANNLYPDIASNIHAPKVVHDTHRKEALTAKEVLAVEQSIAEIAEQKQRESAAAKKDAEGRMQRASEQGKRLYAIYLLASNAGLRVVEISRANVKDFVVKGGQAWLYVWGKGRTEADQKKAIAPEVAAAIRDYLQSRADTPISTSPLFVSTGNRSGGKRIAATTISKMIKRAMKDAGYDSERLTAHSLRHSAAQAALRASGNNVYSAQKYLRHASPATTEIYLHEDEQTEKEERAMAQDIYNLYHGNRNADTRGNLERIISRMNQAQLEQLTAIAAAMA